MVTKAFTMSLTGTVGKWWLLRAFSAVMAADFGLRISSLVVLLMNLIGMVAVHLALYTAAEWSEAQHIKLGYNVLTCWGHCEPFSSAGSA